MSQPYCTGTTGKNAYINITTGDDYVTTQTKPPNYSQSEKGPEIMYPSQGLDDTDTQISGSPYVEGSVGISDYVNCKNGIPHTVGEMGKRGYTYTVPENGSDYVVQKKSSGEAYVSAY